MEWGTLSPTQPLVSATAEDRPPLEVRFVNESSAHLTVSWVDAAGRLRHGRRCAPGAGPLRVRDGSVRPEHVEGTFAGDAFVVYAGPGDDLAANADVVAADAAGAIAVAGWYAVLAAAGTRVVVHEDTEGFGHMCFHPRGGGAWLEREGFDPKLAGCVHVYRLADYLGDRELWGPGGSVLHELSHAYHDCALPGGHGNAAVARRYEAAVHGERLYDAVDVKGPQAEPRTAGERRRLAFRRACRCCAGGRSGVPRRHYATTNAAEFFAELSTAYLCDDADDDYNKWAPFNRSQLARRDPETAALLAKIWDGDDPGVDDDEPAAASCARRALARVAPCLRRRPARDRDA